MRPLLYDSHMHTPLCKHAQGEPEEYAAVAEQRGLKGIIITDHNPMEMEWGVHLRMTFAQFDAYLALVERARREWAGRVDVRLGIESDYAPGMEPALEKLHRMADFNHVLGSVHPHISQYKKLYCDPNDPVGFQRTYFTHLAMAAETGLFDTISHPDLVKNNFPSQWNPGRIMDHIDAVLDRIARTGVAMELNTSGLLKDIQEMNPGRLILGKILLRNIPIVLGSDSHRPVRVGADFEEALDTLADVGFTHVSFFLNRHRQDIPIEAARASLKSASVVAEAL